MLKITEKNDPNSPFFFVISYRKSRKIFRFDDSYYENAEDEEADQHDKLNNREYTCHFKPSSLEDTSSVFINSSLHDISDHLKLWINLLSEYNKESVLFDDPILYKYYEDLSINFKITDEDADYAPYSLEQQKALAEYYDKATIQVSAANIDNFEADELKKEIHEAKLSISRSTKSENVNRLRKIIAKARKFSGDLGKELLIDLFKEGLKWLATGQPPLPF